MRNIYDFYISPEQYAKAELKGINKINLEYRIRHLGWDYQKAINTPINKKIKMSKAIKDKLKKNNISYTTFNNRVTRLGWDYEKAINTPPLTKKESINLAIKKHKEKSIITSEEYEIASTRGICKMTLYHRIMKLKWSKERAISEPINKPQITKNHIWNKYNKLDFAKSK